MDFFQHPYYRLNKILMSAIGQWPYQSKSSSRFFLGIVLILSVIQIGPQIMAVSKYRHDFSIIIECISPLLFDCLCAAKLITCICNSKKILKLMNRLKEDWKVWSNDEEIQILHEYAENGRKYALLYAGSIFLTAILFVTEPILPTIIDTVFKNGTAPDGYPMPLYYGSIDMEKYYFYIIAYTYVGVSTVVGITIASDVMFITIAVHGCAIFAAVGHKLKRTADKEKSMHNINKERAPLDTYHHITTCIDRHNEAIEYANLIEQTYTWCFFLVVGFNMLLMSSTGLQIVTRTGSHQDVFRLIAFVVAQMTHLFIETYMSQILMDHSTNISYYVQSGEWYRLSLKSQKLLGLITMRSNVPCTLTAGKLCALNVETYAVILKTSMSYFTLLSSMQ